MATNTSKTRKQACSGQPFDEVRAALTGLAKDLRTGGRDLYGDVETLVRSARRDTVKLGKGLRGDVERLAKAGPHPPAPPKPLPRVSPAPRRRAGAHAKRAPGGAHPKKTAA